MAKRAEKLVYLAEDKPGKHPRGSSFGGVPMRDLDKADIDRLTDERYEQVTAAHPTLGPLYAPSKAAAKDAPVAEPPAVVPNVAPTAAERRAEAAAVPEGGPEGPLGRG